MLVCIPVVEDRGLESQVCEHFGSSPAFIIVNTETGGHEALVNHSMHHGHGGCAPLTDLLDRGIHALVVGGIGRGALQKAERGGVRTFRATHGTVAETLAAYLAGGLEPVSLEGACAHHGHGHHA